MHTKPGDRLVVTSHRVGEAERDARVIEVRGRNGQPPYVVERSDDGRVGLFYPGPDAYIDHGELARTPEGSG
jgi:hypothetical protein